MPLSEWDIQVLKDRAVSDSVIAELARMDSNTFAQVVATFDAKGGGDTSLLVYRLRAANRSDQAKGAAAMVEREAKYGTSIVDWLAQHLPDTFKTSTAVVEATRKAYGDVEADRLAASGGPHPAAVAAVIRSHYQNGKQSVRVSMIRAAVKAADDRAVAELQEIAAMKASRNAAA